MNLSCIWWDLDKDEKHYIIDVVAVYSFNNLDSNHPVNQVFARIEHNKLPFFDILMVIKAIELYRLNHDIEYFCEQELSDELLLKLKKQLVRKKS